METKKSKEPDDIVSAMIQEMGLDGYLAAKFIGLSCSHIVKIPPDTRRLVLASFFSVMMTAAYGYHRVEAWNKIAPVIVEVLEKNEKEINALLEQLQGGGGRDHGI